jgi:N-hydroxyarylamine O-acetyltransferase
MRSTWIDEYLTRIGAARPASPDLDSLRKLQLAHLYAVPFENLSIHLGEPIVLDQDALVDKVVERRRGGFCYELNGAFAALLSELGYRVSMLSARVYGADGRPSVPFDHMALRVDLAEPWLVDVGFGAFASRPLRMSYRGDQPGPDGVFRIEESAGELDVVGDGKPNYRVDQRAYELADFGPTCWWQQTWPDSHFRRSLVCSVLTRSGRVTLSGDRLTVTDGGERTESTLPSDEEILAAYRTHFGMDLDRVPTVSRSAAQSVSASAAPSA